MNTVMYKVKEKGQIVDKETKVSDKNLGELIRKLSASQKKGDVVGKPVIVEIE
jgi:hypothetical protein